ncbi:hypothetical protein YC2023_094440 [Brassica napus]
MLPSCPLQVLSQEGSQRVSKEAQGDRVCEGLRGKVISRSLSIKIITTGDDFLGFSMYGRKTARKLVREHVYYVAVRTLGRPYALTKYAEKKLSSSCAENGTDSRGMSWWRVLQAMIKRNTVKFFLNLA